MLKALVVVAPIVLAIYCLIQIIQTPPDRVRVMRRWMWVLAVILLPLAGPVAWLVLGRPRSSTPRPQPERRVIPPDDDPDFLRNIRYNRPDDPA